jgi:predicted transcriptional regulator
MEFYMTVLPVFRGAKAVGGLFRGLWRGITGVFIKEEAANLAGQEAANLARRTVSEIAAELGYAPSKAVKNALKGVVARETISPAEREVAARFYERVANEAISGTKEAAAKALNLARAKFLREGGRPPMDIHNFEK